MRHLLVACHGQQLLRLGAVALGCFVLANCSSPSQKVSSRVDARLGVSASPRVIEPGQPVPKGGGTYRVGKPYVVAGRTYVPQENRNYRSEGVASWYGNDFHGRLTANGEIYDMDAISAAHPTMPMPSYARVTSLRSGRSLIVRVNDRGPYHADREIDLSGKAAELLEFRGRGLARVRVEYVGPAPLEGSDDRRLLATLREGSPALDPGGPRAVASARPLAPALADAAENAERRRGAVLAQQALAREPQEPMLAERREGGRAAAIRLASDDPRQRGAALPVPRSEEPTLRRAERAPFESTEPRPGVLGSMPASVGRGLY